MMRTKTVVGKLAAHGNGLFFRRRSGTASAGITVAKRPKASRSRCTVKKRCCLPGREAERCCRCRENRHRVSPRGRETRIVQSRHCPASVETLSRRIRSRYHRTSSDISLIISRNRVSAHNTGVRPIMRPRRTSRDYVEKLADEPRPRRPKITSPLPMLNICIIPPAA